MLKSTLEASSMLFTSSFTSEDLLDEVTDVATAELITLASEMTQSYEAIRLNRIRLERAYSSISYGVYIELRVIKT